MGDGGGKPKDSRLMKNPLEVVSRLKVPLFRTVDERRSYSRSCAAVILTWWVGNQYKKAQAQSFLAFLLAPFVAGVA